MAYMLVAKIKINYKLYKDSQQIKVYVNHVYHICEIC
jgi:hypothetical protein